MSWAVYMNDAFKDNGIKRTRENNTAIEDDIQSAVPIWDFLKISKEEYDEKYSTYAAISSDAVDRQDLDKDNPSNEV